MTTPTQALRKLDLSRFCANELDPREYLRQPWKRGEWVYATNGHIIVRVPADSMPDVGECQKAPSNVDAMYAARFNGAAEFLLMPDLPALNECTACEGVGRIRATKCSHCSGEGGFFHFGIWYDCRNCEGDAAGDGWVSSLDFEESDNDVMRVCVKYDGLGHDMREHGVTQIGVGTYSPVYLHWIAALPQARVMPGNCAPNLKGTIPLAFIFDGGQGLLQPRKEK